MVGVGFLVECMRRHGRHRAGAFFRKRLDRESCLVEGCEHAVRAASQYGRNGGAFEDLAHMKAETDRIAAHDRHGCEDGGVVASSGNNDVCTPGERGDERCFADRTIWVEARTAASSESRASRHFANIANAVCPQPVPVDIGRDNRQSAVKTVLGSDFLDDIDTPFEMRARAGAAGASDFKTGMPCSRPAPSIMRRSRLTAGLLVKDTPAPR